MKILTVLLTILLNCKIFIAQNSAFKLSDTIVSAYERYTTREILFAPGKATLRPESSVILDSIVSFMNNNKNIVLEIGVHFGSHANPAWSWNPTESRAMSITDYLTNHGINRGRLIPKGYGDAKLLISQTEINKAKTEEEKQKLEALNRRVELVILSTDFNKNDK